MSLNWRGFKSELEFAPYSRPFEISVMTIFLIEQNQLFSCRSSPRLLIGSVCGLIYSRRTSEAQWILGAAAWNRSRRIYLPSSAGVLSVELHVDAEDLHVMLVF